MARIDWLSTTVGPSMAVGGALALPATSALSNRGAAHNARFNPNDMQIPPALPRASGDLAASRRGCEGEVTIVTIFCLLRALRSFAPGKRCLWCWRPWERADGLREG